MHGILPDHAPFCVVPDHLECPDDPDGCTSPVLVADLSRGHRASGYAAGHVGGPAGIVLTELPAPGGLLPVEAVESLARFLLALVATAGGGDDPAAGYHAAVQAARQQRDVTTTLTASAAGGAR